MSLPNPFLMANQKPPETHNAPPHVPHNNHKNPRWPPQNNQRGRFNNHRGNSQHPARSNNFHQSSNSFFCSYCKESFLNQMELQIHRRSHQKCPYDECNFNANEVTVAEHIQKVHMKTTKIKDLTTPEDIEKWRDERRKRYPTTANVQLRQQIQEMKQNRGEKLQDSKARFGDNKQKNFIDDRKRNKKEKRKKNDQLKKAKRKAQNLVNKVLEPKDDDDGEEKEALKFKGTNEMDYNKEQPMSSLSLLGAYGSDSESEDEEESDDKMNESLESNEVDDDDTLKNDGNQCEVANDDDEPQAFNDESPLDDEPHDTLNNEAIDDELPLEVQNPKEDHQPLLPSSSKRKLPQPHPSTSKKPKSAIDYSKLRNIKSTNPFLEKLLHREIVHERNYLLQCVSYVVKNNFFDVGNDNQSS